MMEHDKYIIKELREGAIDIEYDGFLKNTHPATAFWVVCNIDTQYATGKQIVVEMPPLSEKMVMSHHCGPVLENEYDFEILGIFVFSELQKMYEMFPTLSQF